MLAIWIAMASVAGTVGHFDDQDVYWIEQRELTCLIANEQSYLSAREDVLIVYPTLCPTVHPNQRQRQAIMENQHVLTCTAGFRSCMIALTRQERRCFFERLRTQASRNRGATRVIVSTAGCRQ